MSEVKKILEKYFEKNETVKLLTQLQQKQRTSMLNQNYFVKVGKNTSELFFKNLITEINLYKNNRDNDNLPSLMDYYIDDEVCVLVLKRINAKTIGIARNKFNLRLSRVCRHLIIDNILNIRNMNIKGNLDNTYNRKVRLDKYLNNSKLYISSRTYNKIVSKYEFIISENLQRVVSHSDLISTNIMLDKDTVYFIDWEFVSLKPMYYDLAYFLLFSKTNNCFNIISEDENYKKSINVSELCKDGIILCLKEIQNNAKLFGKIDDNIVNKNINRWKKELNIILRWLE